MESPILTLYQKLNALPFGGRLFNLGVSLKAPFFRTIKPNIIVPVILRDKSGQEVFNANIIMCISRKQ